jgi:hypothetical protein
VVVDVNDDVEAKSGRCADSMKMSEKKLRGPTSDFAKHTFCLVVMDEEQEMGGCVTIT